MLKQRIKTISAVQILDEAKNQPINEPLTQLAVKLFPHCQKRRQIFVDNVLEIYLASRDKDVLVLHSPGGWGNAHWDGVQDWEKSVVTGVTATIQKLGYSWIMKQYLRSGDGLWGGVSIWREAQTFFFGVSYRAQVLAKELILITESLPKLRIVLVGASQGAAFNNMVTMKLGDAERIYSIELGTFFPHMKRRQLTKRNLAIDSNGLIDDPICHLNLLASTKSYFMAFTRWFEYKAQGKHVKFTLCINTPGHEYRWEYPEIHGRINEFLNTVFGEKP